MKRQPALSSFEIWLRAAAAPALALMVYFGAYLLMLERKVYSPIGTDQATGQNLFDVEPWYRIRTPQLENVLAPAHRLDRAIRREYWTTIEHSSGRRWKNPGETVDVAVD
ncbi:MAG: hypothetical protein ACT4QC_02650 [Planctomycetaceae bacterium]